MEKLTVPENAEAQWRCPHCGILLGVIQGSILSIRYKSLAYRINVSGHARIQSLCRNCAVWIETTVPPR